MNPSILIIAFGLFTMSGAYFNWDWYMYSVPKYMDEVFSRKGTRIILGIAGFMILILGLVLTVKT